jgi:transcriptional regulator with XRE-family HTH domain
MDTMCERREWLYNLRQRHSLTQTQMAEIINSESSHYTRLELGQRDTRGGIRLIYISALSKYFDIPVENLFDAEMDYLESLE